VIFNIPLTSGLNQGLTFSFISPRHQ